MDFDTSLWSESSAESLNLDKFRLEFYDFLVLL